MEIDREIPEPGFTAPPASYSEKQQAVTRSVRSGETMNTQIRYIHIHCMESGDYLQRVRDRLGMSDRLTWLGHARPPFTPARGRHLTRYATLRWLLAVSTVQCPIISKGKGGGAKKNRASSRAIRVRPAE